MWQRLKRSTSFWIGAPLVLFFVFIAVLPAPVAGLFGHGDPNICSLLDSKKAPRAGHPFGFTVQGCDLFSSVIYGARNSIAVAVTVTLGTCVIAIVLGMLAGYYGRWVDIVISRTSEIVFAVPLILGAIVILNSVPERNVWFLSGVLIVFSWPVYMRVMRGESLSVRNRSFIQAARSLGLSTRKILLAHVMPNAVGPVIVLATLQIGRVIAAEATLTYLGIGLQEPALSWGLQLSVAQNYFQAAPHLLIFPSIMLVFAVMGFVLLGEAVRSSAHSGSIGS
jgi:ABC-type dipeptide/oligopeptide/nickel transport system permease subunit